MVMVGGGGGRQLREEGFLADAPGSYWFYGKEMNLQDTKVRLRMSPLKTPTDFPPEATRDSSTALKTVPTRCLCRLYQDKDFQWRISGRISGIIT